jgi:protein-S-isoprenylcysteine O-methyltransferase Ste14
VNVKRVSIVSALITYPLLGALLFAPAGTLDWPAGWSFFIVFVVACLALTRWLYATKPSLLEERLRVGKNQKAWDKIFLVLLYILFLAWWLAMPLDAVRWRWSHVPLALRIAGVVLVGASFYGLYRTFRENPFLSGVVRIQDDRGHSVVSTGPYRFVRHPMYASAFLLFAGVPLWLGSWWGLAIGGALTLLVAMRALLEERTLARELPGYAEYAARVRYRLIPFVW